jgi:acetyl esterase/lipase
VKALVTLFLGLASWATLADEPVAQHGFANVGFMDTVAWKANSAPDGRFVYGQESALQYADLRLPPGAAPQGGYPVIVFIHGGSWRSEWSKNHTEAFVEALAAQGFATWDLEFRRLGHRGGGYPGTFEDVADGADHLRALAESFALDLDRVIAIGHSSGGHLALWLAGRHRLPKSSPLYRDDPLALRGVISRAGVNDLELAFTLGERTDVLTLLGVDSLEAGSQRLDETNPARLLSLGVPQTLMIGDKDSPWRLDMTQRYARQARKAGDRTTTFVVGGANHMDLVDARSGFAVRVGGEARKLLQR